jgi:hypothetical protein
MAACVQSIGIQYEFSRRTPHTILRIGGELTLTSPSNGFELAMHYASCWVADCMLSLRQSATQHESKTYLNSSKKRTSSDWERTIRWPVRASANMRTFLSAAMILCVACTMVGDHVALGSMADTSSTDTAAPCAEFSS